MAPPIEPGDDLLELAGHLADAARAVARGHFRSPVKVDDKPDDSPVTIADREAERAMRELIEATCPDHGIIGEEFGSTRGEAEYVWVLDPIDGTKQFITGKPTFGTLIALTHQGRPVLGVIDAPAQGERWIGALGRPTLHIDPVHGCREVHTRPCDSLSKAALSTTTPDMYAGTTGAAFDRLAAAVKLRVFGGDCYNYGLLASGFCDIACDGQMKYYDFAALIPVIEGAGGVVTDWGGRQLGAGSGELVVAVGDPALHEAVIEALNG